MTLPDDSTIDLDSPTDELNDRLKDTAILQQARLANSRSLHDIIGNLSWRVVERVIDAWPRLRLASGMSAGLAFLLLIGGASAASAGQSWVIYLLACLAALIAALPLAAYQLALEEVIAEQGGVPAFLASLPQDGPVYSPSGQLHRHLDQLTELFVRRWPLEWKPLRQVLAAATVVCLFLGWALADSAGQHFMALALFLLLAQTGLRAVYAVCLSEVARFLLRLSA